MSDLKETINSMIKPGDIEEVSDVTSEVDKRAVNKVKAKKVMCRLDLHLTVSSMPLISCLICLLQYSDAAWSMVISPCLPSPVPSFPYSSLH